MVRLLLLYLQTFNIFSRSPQIRLLILVNKKSSPSLFLQNASLSVVETVICRQNSRLYGALEGAGNAGYMVLLDSETREPVEIHRP